MSEAKKNSEKNDNNSSPLKVIIKRRLKYITINTVLMALLYYGFFANVIWAANIYKFMI